VLVREPEPSTIEAVREFWNENVCGESYLVDERRGAAEYFERISDERYRWHYHLPPFLDEVAAAGSEVLEIGCGMGIDAIQLVRRGVNLTAIDLTEAGIELARSNFARLGLSADLRVGNAEALDFADDSFDAVYSFGVLHHTPDTEKAISEVLRVLKPHGKAFIMLYSRYSLNRLVHRILGRGYEYSRDKQSDAPVTRVYSAKELGCLFRDYVDCSFRKRYLFGVGYRPVADLVPRGVNDLLGRILGWHWLIVGAKG
jgi:ubiquinone/menaquinone biosynthesis C-methylase UbiE